MGIFDNTGFCKKDTVIGFEILNLFDYLSCMKNCPFSDSACMLCDHTDNFVMNGICA